MKKFKNLLIRVFKLKYVKIKLSKMPRKVLIILLNQ